jgi:glycosyltransferase involved in cell wall biosynthesis
VRVLLVDTAREWRGGQSQILLTAQGLRSRGHAVALACRAGGVLEARARQAGLEVQGFAFRGDLSPRALLPLVALVRRFSAEVLQLNDPHAAFCGFLAARLAGRGRTIATRRVDFHLRGALSRLKYARADRVIAVSRAIATILEQDGLARQRIRLVHEGVPDRTPRDGDDPLRQLGVPGDALVIGNVAALTPHKDHATLLAALPEVFARIPRAHVLIFGEGELRPALEAQAGALGLGARCTFAGFRSDLDSLVPRFDVFCLSSRWEGLGTSLLDAMAFARPIVATAAGGIPEAVADGINGRLVPVQDPKALATALIELLDDAAQRQALGRAGRERYLGHFTADRMVEETLAVYREVA